MAKIALFVFIPPGEFTLGGDRRKRDFDYNISAPAIAATTQSINQAEQRLRQRAWFDRGNSRQTSFLPGYCISRNLVTNGEYQEFIQAKNYRSPGIREQEYQEAENSSLMTFSSAGISGFSAIFFGFLA